MNCKIKTSNRTRIYARLNKNLMTLKMGVTLSQNQTDLLINAMMADIKELYETNCKVGE